MQFQLQRQLYLRQHQSPPSCLFQPMVVSLGGKGVGGIVIPWKHLQVEVLFSEFSLAWFLHSTSSVSYHIHASVSQSVTLTSFHTPKELQIHVPKVSGTKYSIQ